VSRPRRVLVALDASPASLAAAGAAADLAARLAAELAGLFVEDEDLLRLAGAAQAWQVDLLSGALRPAAGAELESQLRAQRARALAALEEAAKRRAVTFSFKVVRGRVTPEILAAAAGDLLALGTVGWSRGWGQPFGGTARALVESAAGRAVVLVTLPDGPHDPIVVYDDGSLAASLALELAAGLAGGSGAAVVVVRTPQELAAASRHAALLLLPPGLARAPLPSGAKVTLLALPPSQLTSSSSSSSTI
jgi:nucleotide-binding universal stress UspA family protein